MPMSASPVNEQGNNTSPIKIQELHLCQEPVVHPPRRAAGVSVREDLPIMELHVPAG